MQIYEYGDPNAQAMLVQPVDASDLEQVETEIAEIKKLANVPFRLMTVAVDSWNGDLSPWEAPAVFGKEGFGDGAKRTLEYILKSCGDSDKTYYLGGYSLAGLFCLWAAYETEMFRAAAAVSPSAWFPGILEYMKEHDPKASCIYLSLGDKEEKTRNPVMATVGDRIREGYELLKAQGVHTTLEWNPGNHFKDSGLRTAKGFAWVLNEASAGIE